MWSTVRTKCIRLLQVWGEQRLLPENTGYTQPQYFCVYWMILIFMRAYSLVYITTINNNHVYNFRQSPYEIKKKVQ